MDFADCNRAFGTMKRSVGCCIVMGCVLAATVGFTRPAAAQSPWYVSGSLGAYQRGDSSGAMEFSSSRGSSLGTNTTTFDTGLAVNVGVGYRLPMGFRVEGELGYSEYNIDTESPAASNSSLFPFLNGRKISPRSGGDRERYSGTINLFYDLPVRGRVVPYIGAGFGTVLHSGYTTYFTEAGGERTFVQTGAAGLQPAILAEAGLSIKLSPKWSVVPAYRFEHVFATSNAEEENASIFKAGLRYAF